MQIQIVRFAEDGTPTVILGDPECDRDPCAKHERCHCMCPCMPDGDDNCTACTEMFND